jgi:MFS family permease
MTHSDSSVAPPLTRTQWLICVIAALGFAFDIYELLMLPLVIGPALGALEQIKPGTPEYQTWVGLLFYVPAVCGGIFGLLGGYLTDRLGRRRVLTWSILVYAFSSLAAGFSTSAEMFLVLRCTTFIGVCVEFVAGIAWIAELFPHPRQREKVLGYTQAFSSFGGLMVSGMYVLTVKYAASFPAIYGGHEAWRYTLISGVIPALPLLLIRPFLPESPVWAEKKRAGTLKRPSFAELFRPEYRRTTIVTAILMALSYAPTFGALQHLPRIVPGLPEVVDLTPQAKQAAVGTVQIFQETGGLVGRFLLAFLAVQIVSRQRLLRLFVAPALVIIPLVFLFPAVSSLEALKWCVFLAGTLVVGQLSFWGNYLPRVYPLHLRGTGESFAANVGGRMIGTFAAVVTTQLAAMMPGPTPFAKLAYAAATVAAVVYVIAIAVSFKLPEPARDQLPD